MYQSDTEMLFPSRVITTLGDQRGRVWQELVRKVSAQAEGSLDNLAFGLMMIRLDGCLTCHADSHRAMRGCTACARQTVNRFKGSDSELVGLFRSARAEVEGYLRGGNGGMDDA